MANPGDEIFNPRTGQRMRFLKTRKDTQGELLQIDCTNAPGGVKEPEHIHPYQENRFKVLSGSMMFSINGSVRKINSGESLSIPAKTPHFFWNGSEENVHYIQEFQPALKSEEFFEDLFRLAKEGKLNEQGTANPLLMAVFIPRYWNEIRVTKPPQIIQKIFFGVLNPIGRLLGYRSS